MATYVELQELPKFGVPLRILGGYSDEEVATAMSIASSEADTYLSAHYAELPLSQYPDIIKKHVASAILKNLLDIRGRSPQGDDSTVDNNYALAIKFYENIQKKKQAIPQAAVTPKASNAVVVASALPDGTPRGW